MAARRRLEYSKMLNDIAVVHRLVKKHQLRYPKPSKIDEMR